MTSKTVRTCLAVVTTSLPIALGCPSDDPPSEPYEPYAPVAIDGLAVYAGADRWIGEGEEVDLEGIAVGDAAALGWDLDGDGTFETEGAVASFVGDAAVESELVFRALGPDGAETIDSLVVHVSPPGEDVLSTPFGPYFDYEVDVVPANGGDPPTLAEAWNVDQVWPSLEDEMEQQLFAVWPNYRSAMHMVYVDLEVPPLATTDSVLHAFHMLYDQGLQMAEQERLAAAAEELAAGLVVYLERERAAASAERAADLEMAVAHAAVAARLVDPAFAPPVSVAATVEAELALIEAHAGFATSPIFGRNEDYSQYVPRGHYAGDEALERYFRVMIWLGRTSFRIQDSTDAFTAADGRRETLCALVVARALYDLSVDGTVGLELWETIYEPTTFFVGEADDLTPMEYRELAQEIYGADLPDLSVDDLADPTLLGQFRDAALELRDPRITSDFIWDCQDEDRVTKGLRLMGQRFTPDSYMFEELVYDEVGTSSDMRLMPSGLDVMAVLGSERAYTLLDEQGETDYLNYDTQMTKLREEFGGLGPHDWAQNLYWSWLWALEPLAAGGWGEGYPHFMRSQRWEDRALTGALGSWAELRHDTILYGKQSYSDIGGSVDDPAAGYAEPVPDTYARLASVARLLREGLDARGLLHHEIGHKLAQLEEGLLTLRDIAVLELQDTPLTDDQDTFLLRYSSFLYDTTTFSDEITGGEEEGDEGMALIADVHTDPNTSTVLEVGVGSPGAVFVLVRHAGQTFVAQGAMYSYYEFPWPMSDRLTDESWQELLRSGDAPDPPPWSF